MRASHLLLAGILGLSLPAAAQTAAASDTAAAAAAPAPETTEKLICRKQVETGSLVKGKRTCMTRSEWAKVADAAREGGQYLVDQNTGRPSGQ